MYIEKVCPNVGKGNFMQHQAELEQGLRQLKDALGLEHSAESDAQFFNDFMMWNWDPFDRMCDECAAKTKPISDQIKAMEEQLFPSQDSSLYQLFLDYKALLSAKDPEMLNCAFLMGYQTALRFLMMGLSPASQVYASILDEKESHQKA